MVLFVVLALGFSVILVGWPVQILAFFYRSAEIVSAAPLMWPFAFLVVTNPSTRRRQWRCWR